MRFRFLRGAATATTNHLSGATLKQLAMEFLVIVAGILAVFGVDSWRQDREELRVLNAHLSDLAAEVQNNLETIARIRSVALESKIRNLETVLRFLGDPDPPVLKDAGDPAVVLDSIRARRDELRRLARNEAAVATGQWYALARLKMDFEYLLKELKRRDGVLVSIEPPPADR